MLLTLVRALIVSKVDYCNSVLAGVSRHLLQSVLNAAARLVYLTRVLKVLIWCFPGCLDCKIIAFKMLLFTCSVLSHIGCVEKYSFSRWTVQLSLTFHCLYSSFSISAPTAWNNLPAHIRSCTSLSQFLSKLKSHLFITSFPPHWYHPI